MAPRVPITTTIERPRDGDILDRDRGLLWKVNFTKRPDEKSASTNVEMLTQAELITLWRQIGVLFNLEGMRDGLSDAEIKNMGIICRPA